MSTYRVNVPLVSDKTRNAITTTEYIKHGDKWLNEAIDNTVSNITTPEQFGAVGDGVADDTLALQTAVNQGGVVMLKNKYRITSTINITKSYTTIEGVGTIYGDLAVDGAILRGYSDNVNPVQLDHVTIRDISIVQNPENTVKHTGISFIHEIQTSVSNYGFMDILIDGVTIEGVSHRGILIHGGSYTQTNMTRPYVTMQNCYISRCGTIGICQSKVITKIIACTVRLSGHENITIDNGCWQCVVANCTLHLANGGCGNIGIDQCDRCVITGNHIVNFDYDAQKSDDYDNAIRLNCRTGNVTSLIFCDNTIIGGKYGVWIGSSEKGYKGSGVFNNNVFLSIGVSDFKFDNIAWSIIKGNSYNKVDNDEFKSAISLLNTDVPVTIPLSECVNEGYILDGTSTDNKAVITERNIFITTKFMREGKMPGDIPFKLPITTRGTADYLYQDGAEICVRGNGDVQIYGDYVNMDNDDLVEFSISVPRL